MNSPDSMRTRSNAGAKSCAGSVFSSISDAEAISPPAAIFNALNDALQGLGVELNETPLTPAKILSALAHRSTLD